METAGQVEPSNEDIATVRALIERVEWVFARTMAEHPHWYVVRPFPPERPDAGLRPWCS